MSEMKLSEKELLMLKGNALRMRFKAETTKTKNEIIQPFKQVKANGLALVSSPVVKTVALDLLLKRFLSVKGLGYSALGIAALYLLQNSKNTQKS